MKRFLLVILSLIVIVFIYIFFEEYSYTPLKKNDFKILFPNNSTDIYKICSNDFLGISNRGKVYDIYKYGSQKVSIDTMYPIFKEKWENTMITDKTIFSKWRNCPVNSEVIKLYSFMLTTDYLKDNNDCFSSFLVELNNKNNYYSYIYFNELEQYFLLYISDKEEIYYVRKRGV